MPPFFDDEQVRFELSVPKFPEPALWFPEFVSVPSPFPPAIA
jgi:hypothetical protein